MKKIVISTLLAIAMAQGADVCSHPTIMKQVANPKEMMSCSDNVITETYLRDKINDEAKMKQFKEKFEKWLFNTYCYAPFGQEIMTSPNNGTYHVKVVDDRHNNELLFDFIVDKKSCKKWDDFKKEQKKLKEQNMWK